MRMFPVAYCIPAAFNGRLSIETMHEIGSGINTIELYYARVVGV
jgi:hypothetical protein